MEENHRSLIVGLWVIRVSLNPVHQILIQGLSSRITSLGARSNLNRQLVIQRPRSDCTPSRVNIAKEPLRLSENNPPSTHIVLCVLENLY
jgi:hypothetical protein